MPTRCLGTPTKSTPSPDTSGIWRRCSALQPALHTLEITVRNRLFNISRRIVDETKLSFDKVPCWLDARPPLLADPERQAVEKAKETIAKRSSPMTEGRLVSALGFGFWVSLCKRSYEQGAGGPRLWPELAMRGFPHLPRTQRTRSQVFHALDPLRDLRNRVSHHEAVWDRRLDRSHRDIVETIGWINRDLAATLQAHSPLPTVLDRGVAGFRSQAEGTIATGLPRRRRTAAVPLRMPEPPEAEDLLAPPAAPVGNDGADAESFVAKVLRSQGWTVAFYTNRRGYGFDLWARRENRAMVIEVKSSLAGLGTVSLTPTEYEAARRHGDSYFLALVEHVASASPQLRMIQNPAAKLKMEKRATDSYVIPRSEWVRAMD